MADFLNLDSRGNKLKKEQQKRRDAARLRIQRERRSKEAAAKDQAKIEEQIRARKLEQRRKEEEARKQEEADQIRTAGISYKESLLAVTADGEGDKILLPPSALESLSRQDAVGLGPMLFELTCTTSGAAPTAQQQPEKAPVLQGGTITTTRTTHAGVLEFVADEGTIGLPRKVVLSLLGAAAHQVPSRTSDENISANDDPENEKAERPAVEGLENVVVRYVRLAKATFARVVPETVGLSQVSELRAMLEHNMRNHATLTVGDHLSVWRRGKEFSLKVVELRPEPQVTVIDTDMEIELDLPEKAREQLQEKGAQDRAKTLRAHMGAATTSSRGSSPMQSLSPPPSGGGYVVGGKGSSVAAGGMDTSTTGLSPMDDSESDDDSDLDSDDERSTAGGPKKRAFDLEKHRLAKFQQLPEEPPRDEEGVFTCQLRTTEGKFTRRFRFADALGVLLDFCEAQGGVPGQYRLVMRFPRRVLTRDDASAGTTLREAGLTSKQESVILERL
ncbi:unnamed protein product [Ectocarpus sp. 8 AP-2014]